jgi:hypothetical protein
MFLLCELAKQMLLLVSSLVRMRSSEPWKEAVVIAEHENGLGVESGQWCPFLRANKISMSRVMIGCT